MEKIFISDKEFKTRADLSGRITHFKLVSLAPTAVERLGGSPDKISEAVSSISGYYIFSSDSKQLREAMHTYVDLMIDAIEKQP